MNRLYLQYVGTAPTAAELNTFAATAASHYQMTMCGMISPQVTLNELIVQDIGSSVGASGLVTVSYPGQLTGNMVSAGAAVVVNFLIARRYRGGKPKIYVPGGVAADLATPQTWTTAFQSSALGFWNSWVTDLIGEAWTGGGPFVHVNVSFYEGFVVDTNPITGRARNIAKPRTTPLVDPVLGYSVRPVIGSQRRRY
jgi:hypothetical protein